MQTSVIKNHKKLLTIISKKISQIPLVNKNFDSSYLFFLDPYRYAETPVNKTKTGAQKWVITLVKKNIGVAVDKSVRLEVNDPKKK